MKHLEGSIEQIKSLVSNVADINAASRNERTPDGLVGLVREILMDSRHL